MVNSPTLAQLRDIHLPPAIGFWPLAPGWYILGFLVILLMILFGMHCMRRYQQGKAKRQALCLLKQVEAHFLQHQDAQKVCIQLSELLHRVALAYYPRRDVASLHGEKWIKFLNQQANKIDFTPLSASLIRIPYQQEASNIDVDLLFKLTKHWIEQRGKPCSN